LKMRTLKILFYFLFEVRGSREIKSLTRQPLKV